MSRYDDIINLPHHVSGKHPRMSMENRAAQFAPFAALTGHGYAIAETARLTAPRRALSAGEQQALSLRFSLVIGHLHRQPRLIITYFIPDILKSGGRYARVVGIIKKYKEFERELLLTDGTLISLDDIISIDGDIFRDIEG